MEKQDIQNILAILKAAYPYSYKDLSEDAYKDTLRLWYMMFQDEKAEDVNMAVKELIKTRKEVFTPAIGEVTEKLNAVKKRSGAVVKFVAGPEEMEMLRRLNEKYEQLEQTERRLLE